MRPARIHSKSPFEWPFDYRLVAIADGVLTFSVGMGFVAFTPDWQRLGDMAARTLVVRAKAAPTT